MKSQNICTKNIYCPLWRFTRRRIKKKRWIVLVGRSCLLHGLKSCIVQVVNISLGKLEFFQPPLKLITSLLATHAPLQPAGAIYFRRWPVRLQPATITLYFDNSDRKLCRRSENVLPSRLINRR